MLLKFKVYEILKMVILLHYKIQITL